MAWYIPIYKNDEGELRCATGSDNVSHSDYVRRDKVREFIQGIAKREFCGMKPVVVYSITDAQFWDADIWDPAKVIAAGRRVYGCI